MGIPLCCMSERNEIYNSNGQNYTKKTPLIKSINDEKTNKIIKIQSFIRGFISFKKFVSDYNSLKSEISKDLEKRKLMNETIITECESYLIYSEIISNKKMIPFLEQMEQNKEFKHFYLKLSKYSFSIPYYIVTSPNEVYRGSWNINKRYQCHGVKFEFNDNMRKNKRIEGIFNNGFLSGQGLVIYSNGEIKSGKFIKNELDGIGEHYRVDKSRYKGDFKNGKYNGLGQEIFEDGSIFEGFFSDNEKKYGKFTFKNGSEYQGEFLNNVFHGKGIFKSSNKKSYNGNWKDGKMNGKGKYIYPNGSIYDGEFLDGKKDGFGKYIWGKDRYYEGSWKNDKQNGYGIYYDKNKITKGIWVDGKISYNDNPRIKKMKTFLIKGPNNNKTPVKKGETQEYFYHKKNLTVKKRNINQLNFNPTAKGKAFETYNSNKINLNKNQNSTYSIESANTDKNCNNNCKKEFNNNNKLNL